MDVRGRATYARPSMNTTFRSLKVESATLKWVPTAGPSHVSQSFYLVLITTFLGLISMGRNIYYELPFFCFGCKSKVGVKTMCQVAKGKGRQDFLRQGKLNNIFRVKPCNLQWEEINQNPYWLSNFDATFVLTTIVLCRYGIY